MSNDYVAAETLKRIKKAIPNSKGIVMVVCKKAKISRSTYQRAKKIDPEIEELMQEEEEEFGDECESALLNGVNQGNPTLIIFALKTRFRRRGWAETTTIETKKIDKEVLSQAEAETKVLLKRMIDEGEISKVGLA